MLRVLFDPGPQISAHLLCTKLKYLGLEVGKACLLVRQGT